MGHSVYRPEIDGLRALAIIAVIAYHFSADLLQSGFLGVDIFFVISGYVITAALCQRQESGLRIFLLDFYARRMKRLVPALALCILVTGVSICLVNPEPRTSLETGVAALFGLSNMYLLAQAADYFGSPSQLNVFAHTWSLGVEEQFYFVFPLLVWICGRQGWRTGGPRVLVATISVLSTISISTFCYLSLNDASAAFYLMPARFWELGAGALCFLELGDKRQGWVGLPGMAPIALVLLLAVLFAPLGLSAYSTVAAVVLTFLLIGAVSPGSVAFSILSHRSVVFVGRISYSLYLWHWAVISISRWTVGIDSGTIPFQIALILLLAVLSYRYVERPLREAAWTSGSARTVAMGALGLVALALLLTRPVDGRLYAGEVQTMASVGTGSLTKEYSVPGGSSRWLGDRCVISGDEDIGKSISIDDCTLGSLGSARQRVLVVGDSFSAAFVQGFDELVSTDGYAVTITSSWGASPAPGIPNRGSWSKTNDYYWATVVPALLTGMKEGDVVFLASDLAGYSPTSRTNDSDRLLEQLKRQLEAFSNQLAERRIGLAVLDGNPFAREANCEPSSAIPQWFRPVPPCKFISRDETLRRRAGVNSVLTELHQRDNVAIVDLMDIFCPGRLCTYQALDGRLLYRDSHSHPSVEAVVLSSARIREAIVAISSVEQRATDSNRGLSKTKQP